MIKLRSLDGRVLYLRGEDVVAVRNAVLGESELSAKAVVHMTGGQAFYVLESPAEVIQALT